MERLSSGAEQLLCDIIEHRNKKGKCDLEYWAKRFEDLEANFALETQVRSQFGTLSDEGMIFLMWADGIPYALALLDGGFAYYERFLQGGQGQVSDVKVFASYNQKTGSDFVEALVRKLEGKATVIRDKTHIDPWGSISGFMKSIREQDFAVAVITDEYLKSQPCMYEAAMMMRENDWQRRIIPAVLDTSIYSRKDEYIRHWTGKKQDLENKAKAANDLSAVQSLAKDADQISKICTEISDFLEFVLDSKNPPIFTVLDEIEIRVNISSKAQKIPKEVLEKAEMHRVREALSRYAQELLVKAAKAEKQILFTQSMSGYQLGLDGEEGEFSANDRVIAIWKEAISQLQGIKYIEQVDAKGEVYRLTAKGYEWADKLEVQLILD